MCTKNRGVILLDVVHKIIDTLLKNRIMEYLGREVGEYQCGFRKRRSVMDQIFTMKEIQITFYEYKEEVHALFIKFKQAYIQYYTHRHGKFGSNASVLIIPTKHKWSMFFYDVKRCTNYHESVQCSRRNCFSNSQERSGSSLIIGIYFFIQRHVMQVVKCHQ